MGALNVNGQTSLQIQEEFNKKQAAEAAASAAAAAADTPTTAPVFTTGPAAAPHAPPAPVATPSKPVGAATPGALAAVSDGSAYLPLPGGGDPALLPLAAPATGAGSPTDAGTRFASPTSNTTTTVGGGTAGTGAGGAYQLAPTSSVSGPVAAPLPTGIIKLDPNSGMESDRQGLAYQLGGSKNFTADLTAAMQASASNNAANLIGSGNAAAGVGAQSQQALSGIGAAAQQYGQTSAAGTTNVANLLGYNGANLTQQGDAVQNRAAPTLDVAQQNYALGQSQNQADALNQSGTAAYGLSTDAQGRQFRALDVGQQDATLDQANLQSAALGRAGANAYTAAAAAQGRAAPDLNTAQQNAALAASGQGATALQGLSGQAQQLGLSSDGRTAPQAQLAGANSAIKAAQGNAGTVGDVGNAALALSQNAAGRSTIAPANYGLSQSMLGQGVASSQSAQQTGQQLTDLEATQGPSAAQALLAQGQASAAAQAMSLARSGRGWGGSAQGLADAQRAQAAGLMSANNQAAGGKFSTRSRLTGT